jgi:RHS repeat-associated protein
MHLRNRRRVRRRTSGRSHLNGYRDFDPATGRYVEGDPSGLAGGLNPYAYSGANPLSNFDPLGLYCTSGGGWTSCSYPGGSSFRLPTPQGGFPDINASYRALYHKYDVQRALGCADPQDVMQSIINNPTPGNPNPASPDGTANRIGMVPVFYYFSAMATVLLGLPAFFLLLRFRIIRWWSVVVGGLVIGALMGTLVGAPNHTQLPNVLLMAATGAASALGFWLIWGDRDRGVRYPEMDDGRHA